MLTPSSASVAEEAQRRDSARDEEWLKLIGSKYPDLVDEMKSTMEASRELGRTLPKV